MTPEQLRRLRELCDADRPARAALVELLCGYEATPGQLAAMRVSDVRGDALIFASSRGASGRTSVRLVPSAAARLAPLLVNRAPDEPLFDASASEIESFLGELFEAVGAPMPKPSGAESVLYVTETEHGVLRVVKDQLGLWFMTDVLPQGVVYANGEPPAHVFLWSHLDALVPAEPRLLLLGGGAFVGAAYLEERLAPARLDVIELDPRCLTVARMFFSYEPAMTTEVYVADAREVVRTSDQHYDAVIHDVADAEGTLDWLTDSTYAEALAARAPVLMANLITSLDSTLLEGVSKALRRAGFEAPRFVPVRTRAERDRVQNILVLATHRNA